MTAAEFTAKWFTDPYLLRIITSTHLPGDDTYVYRHEFAADLASLTPADRAAVSCKFPPHIWNSLPAVSGAIVDEAGYIIGDSRGA